MQNNDDLEIIEEDYIPNSANNQKTERKEQLLQFLSKDIQEFTEEDFQKLSEIAPSDYLIVDDIYKANDDDTGKILNTFAYHALQRAMELRSPESIECALRITESIINSNLYNYKSPVHNTYSANNYKPEQDSPSLLQKYRADADDLLFMSFNNNKDTGRITIDYKLYPQAAIKQAAFRNIMMETNTNKQQSEKSNSLDTPLGNQITSRDYPNQRQYQYILNDMDFLANAGSHTTQEDQMRIDRMTPIESSHENTKGPLLISQDQQKQKAQAGHTYKTDSSKYPGKDPASLAMHFNDHYQLTALKLGIPAEEALKQNPDNLIISIHKQYVSTDPEYNNIPDTLLEKLEKLPQQVMNYLPWQAATSNTPQITGNTDTSNIFATKNNQPRLGGNNLLAGPEAPNKSPTNNLPTLGQVLLGTAIIGSVIASGKLAYDYYNKNFGKNATPEKILEAKTLLSEVATSQIDINEIYNAFNDYHHNLAQKLNNMYDNGKQNSQEYKKLREELDITSKNKEDALKLEEGIQHLKESYKTLNKPGLKEKYVQSLIDEYHSLEKICDNLLYQSLETQMKHQDLLQNRKPSAPTKISSHAAKVKKTREEQSITQNERH